MQPLLPAEQICGGPLHHPVGRPVFCSLQTEQICYNGFWIISSHCTTRAEQEAFSCGLQFRLTMAKFTGILAVPRSSSFYDLTDGRIVSTAIVDTMGNGHGALTGFLKAYAVDALICGGIGTGRASRWRRPGSGSYPARPAARTRRFARFLSGTLQYQPPILFAVTTRTRPRARLRQPHLLGCLLSRTTGGTLP